MQSIPFPLFSCLYIYFNSVRNFQLDCDTHLKDLLWWMHRYKKYQRSFINFQLNIFVKIHIYSINLLDKKRTINKSLFISRILVLEFSAAVGFRTWVRNFFLNSIKNSVVMETLIKYFKSTRSPPGQRDDNVEFTSRHLYFFNDVLSAKFAQVNNFLLSSRLVCLSNDYFCTVGFPSFFLAWLLI